MSVDEYIYHPPLSGEGVTSRNTE